MSSFNPDIHVPGQWRCAKCRFQLTQKNLNAADGTVTARDEAGDHCPNDGSPLWRVTWKQEYASLYDMAVPLFEKQGIVDRICAEEGATVMFTGDNPDFNGLPNSCVVVCGSFTGWIDKDVRADSVIEALRLAEGMKRQHEGQD